MNPCCRLLLDCENIHSGKYVGQVASAELCLSRWQAWSTGMVGPICGDRRCVNRLASSIVNGVNALKKWYLRNKGGIRAKHCNSVLTDSAWDNRIPYQQKQRLPLYSILDNLPDYNLRKLVSVCRAFSPKCFFRFPLANTPLLEPWNTLLSSDYTAQTAPQICPALSLRELRRSRGKGWWSKPIIFTLFKM